jgi:hypothetical protein
VPARCPQRCQQILWIIISAFDNKTSPATKIVLHHFHGVGTRISPSATAFGMRRPHFTALIYAAWDSIQVVEPVVHREWAADVSSGLKPLALRGGYANLLGPTAHGQINGAYGDNGHRLIEMKNKFDPKNVFSSALPLPL